MRRKVSKVSRRDNSNVVEEETANHLLVVKVVAIDHLEDPEVVDHRQVVANQLLVAEDLAVDHLLVEANHLEAVEVDHLEVDLEDPAVVDHLVVDLEVEAVVVDLLEADLEVDLVEEDN